MRRYSHEINKVKSNNQTLGWVHCLSSSSSSMSSSVSVSWVSGCRLLLLSHCSMSLASLLCLGWLRHWPIVDMILKSYEETWSAQNGQHRAPPGGWGPGAGILARLSPGPGHQAGDRPVTHNKWIFRCHTGHCLNHIKFAIVSLLTLRHESRQPGSYLAS